MMSPAGRTVFSALLLVGLGWSALVCAPSYADHAALMTALGLHVLAALQIVLMTVRRRLRPRLDAAACISMAGALSSTLREAPGVSWVFALVLVLGAIALATLSLAQFTPTEGEKRKA